jgi:hypothetical protein
MSIIQMMNDITDAQARIHKLEASRDGTLAEIVRLQGLELQKAVNKITELERKVRFHQKVISDVSRNETD